MAKLRRKKKTAVWNCPLLLIFLSTVVHYQCIHISAPVIEAVWSKHRQYVGINCSLSRQGKCSSLYLLNNLHANDHKLTIKWPTCWIFLFVCLLSLPSEINSHYLAFSPRFTLDAWTSTCWSANTWYLNSLLY